MFKSDIYNVHFNQVNSHKQQVQSYVSQLVVMNHRIHELQVLYVS